MLTDDLMLNTARTIIMYEAAVVGGEPHLWTKRCVGVNKFGL